MSGTWVRLAGGALLLAVLPACVHPPAPSHAVARPPVPLAAPVARRADPHVRYIDVKAIQTSEPSPTPEIVPVKAEQPAPRPAGAEPATLELSALDDIPTITAPGAPPPAAESPAIVALRHYQGRAPERAAEVLAPLDRWNQDALKTLLPLAARLSGEASSADPEELAASLAQLDALASAVRERAALRVTKLCFCRPVQSPARYGVYEPVEEHHQFRPGEVMAVYVELRNFACEPRGGTYRTRVASTVEILDAAGQVAGRFDFEKSDVGLSPRRDYCHVGRFPLQGVPAGAYTLRLKVTDVPTGRVARASLEFRVAAAGNEPK